MASGPEGFVFFAIFPAGERQQRQEQEHRAGQWSPSHGFTHLSPLTGILAMIKNGHHAAEEAEGAETAHRGAEKRKRVVRVWCDGWCVHLLLKYYTTTTTTDSTSAHESIKKLRVWKQRCTERSRVLIVFRLAAR